MKRFAAIFAFLMLAPQIANAGSFLRVCTATGNCGLCDIVAQAILLGKWLITGAGGLALFIIVFAAFGFITSAGNPEKINASKKQITGALLGIVIVMLAFQLVVIIIGMLATPDRYVSYDATQTGTQANTEAGKQGSLTRFLGVAWWTICSEQDLRSAEDKNENAIGSPGSQYKGTDVCTYWGDGTPCSKDLEKICMSGKCVDEQDGISNACEFLVKFDKTYQESETHEAYKCQTKNDCDQNNIEDNFCPGDETIKCCAKKLQ